MAGVYYERPKPLIRRMATVADTSLKIQRYDSDNLYPQRVAEIIEGASTLKTISNRIADFINGEGFQDQVIAKMIVNRKGIKGQTMNRVLQRITPDYQRFDTPVLHVGYNLLGQMCELNPVPFEYIRLGILENDCLTKLGYSANWERDGRSGRDQHITWYDAFNPDPAVVLQQIERDGGIGKYKGQIIYDTPDPGQYPKAACHAVLDDAQVQQEIGMFKVGNTQNSFLATLAILFPGEFASAQEEWDFKELIQNKTGSRHAGTRIGLQDKSGTRKASDIFQTLQPANLDKIFEFTETSVKTNIMESEAFPQILMGKSPSGLLAQGDMEEAYTYCNSITRNRRQRLEEFFSTILAYWETPIITDGKIIEQRYIVGGEEGLPGGAIQVNDNIKNMTGMQAINFERILRKYGQGKYNRQQASQMLTAGFGLTTEEINKLLDGIDQLVAEEKAAQDPTTGAPAPAGKVALMRKKYETYVMAMATELL